MPKRTASFNDWRLSKLADPDTALEYLNAASTDSPQMFRKAIKNVIQARFQMKAAAKEVGITREALYKALSEKGNPTDETQRAVLRILGYGLGVVKLELASPEPQPMRLRFGHRAEKRHTAIIQPKRIATASAASALQLPLQFEEPKPAFLTGKIAGQFLGTGDRGGIRPSLFMTGYMQQATREETWKLHDQAQPETNTELAMISSLGMPTTPISSQASMTPR